MPAHPPRRVDPPPAPTGPATSTPLPSLTPMVPPSSAAPSSTPGPGCARRSRRAAARADDDHSRRPSGCGAHQSGGSGWLEEDLLAAVRAGRSHQPPGCRPAHGDVRGIGAADRQVHVGSGPGRALSGPEVVECLLIGVVTPHLDDPPVLDPHELTPGDVQGAPLMLGGGVLHCDDVLITNADVKEADAQGPTGERAELGQEVVTDVCPAAVGSCQGTAPGKDPDSFCGETGTSGIEVPVSDRVVEAPDDVDILRLDHACLPGFERTLEGRCVPVNRAQHVVHRPTTCHWGYSGLAHTAAPTSSEPVLHRWGLDCRSRQFASRVSALPEGL